MSKDLIPNSENNNSALRFIKEKLEKKDIKISRTVVEIPTNIFEIIINLLKDKK